MHIPTTLSTILSTLLLSLPTTTFSQPTGTTPGHVWGTNNNAQACAHQAISAQWRDQIVENYLTMWNVPDLSLYDSIMSPNASIYQDRLPDGTGNGSYFYPVNNQSTFNDFVALTRRGFSQYSFENLMSFSEDNLVVFRWAMHGVSDGNPQSATANVPNGTEISYNGTDIFILDRCSGLIDQVITAQDFVDYFHQLKLPVGQF